MFDLTEGSTWFFSGLGVTLLFVALVFLFALFARRVDQR